MNRILEELHLSNFRRFEEEHEIPLNGDVVLVHGPNGSGKSSLLSAIELGLTGKVMDLARFKDDYPSCLVNDTGREAVVDLTLSRGSSGSEATVVVNQANVTGNHRLTENDAVTFRERNFLSQTQLGRLLEIYQTPEKSSGEPPLIRFMRELLHLESVEAIRDGLYVAGDVRRVRKAVPTYRHFEERKEGLQEKVEMLRTRRNELKVDVEKLRNDLSQSLSQDFWTDPPDGDQIFEMELPGLEEPADKETLSRLERDLERLSELQQDFKDIQSSREDLSDSDGRVRDTSDELKKELEVARNELNAALEEIERNLNETALEEKLDVPESGHPEARFDAFRATTTREIDSVKSDFSRYRTLKEKANKADEEVTSAKATIEKISHPDVKVERASRLINLLEESLVVVEGEHCPVCNRDYSEVDGEPLSQAISSKVEDLRHKLRKEREIDERLRKERSRKKEWERRLDEYEARLKGKSGQALSARIEYLTSISNCLGESADLRDTIGSIRSSLKKQREKSEEIDKLEVQQERKIAKFRRIILENDIELPDSDTPLMDPDWQQQATQKVNDILDKERARYQEFRKTSSLVEELEKKCKEGRNTAKKITEVEATRSHIKTALEAAKGATKEARTLAKASEDVVTEVIGELFNDDLNRLLIDIFQRLVIDEQFNPSLAEPQVKRKKFRASIGAKAGEREFKNIGAVLSSGNLNTAALSLFVALHIVRNTPLPLLLLDDPVQNLDDVHVVELAALLRIIAYQLNRQVVLTTHDEDLFEYLSSELQPTEQGRELVRLMLRPDGSTVRVCAERIGASKKEIQFGQV